MFNNNLKIILAFLYLLPLFTFAAPGNLKELIALLTNIASQTSLVIIALSILAFFWGIALFILRSGDGTERDRAKNIMLWGLIGVFVLFSFWGIIQIIKNTFLN